MDISSLATVALAPALSVPAMPAVGSTAATELVTQRFNAVMSAPDPVSVATPASSMGLPDHVLASSNETKTLGNQILTGLQSASADYAQKWQNVTAGLTDLARQPSTASMLKVQSEMLQVSVQYELVGKAVARSTQNIDTLVRMS